MECYHPPALHRRSPFLRMLYYPLFRPLLFALDPETAHDLVLAGLDAAAKSGIARLALPRLPPSPVEAMGLAFPNRVGVAAGLDKDAEHIDGLATLGFGFIECGTVTPRPQRGNPKPRLFRLAEAEALINRLGFNNQGIDHFIANVERARFGPKHGRILGLNIGRNFDTPNARAIDDYRACFAAVYAHASYVTVNISSPNTPGLRALHENSALEGLLSGLKVEQARLAQKHGKYTPLVVKLSPDLAAGDLARVARSLVAHRIDGVIATNTTVDRSAVKGMAGADEAGGLSGRPLMEKSSAVLRVLARQLDGALPIIGTGGIMSGADAKAKIDAGATLVQIYSGLVYRGPALIAEIAKTLAQMRAA